MKYVIYTTLVFTVSFCIAVSQIKSFVSERGKKVITLRNDGYSISLNEVSSERIIVINGFESLSLQEFKIPERIFTIVMQGNIDPQLSIVSSNLSAQVNAHPFYFVNYALKNDSNVRKSITSIYHLRQQFSKEGLKLRILDKKLYQGKTYIRISIPLLLWNEEKKTTSFVESVTVGINNIESTVIIGTKNDDHFLFEKESFSQLPKSVLKYVDTSGSWINYSKPYIRFVVRKDSVYKITRDWFIASGVQPDQIDSRTVRLIIKGEEVPLIDKGMNDGQIDPSDYFLFYGKRNYTEDYRKVGSHMEEYPQYIDKYDSSSIYWVTWGGSTGLRGNKAPDLDPLNADSLLWYSELIHFEQDIALQNVAIDLTQKQIPGWSYQTTWNMGLLVQGNTASYPIFIRNLYPGLYGWAWYKTLSYFQLPAGSNPAHLISISVNQSAPIDSIGFNYMENALLQGNIPENVLNEGANTFIIKSYGNPGTTDYTAKDWYEIEYPRWLLAENNYLTFSVRDIRMVGKKVMKVKGFLDSNIFILKIRKGTVQSLNRSISQNRNLFDCLLLDSVQIGDQYIFYISSSVCQAPIGTQSNFANLRSKQNMADYLLITSLMFESSAKQYADFITSQYSVNVKTIFVNNIYDEFGFGYFSPEAIKAFLFYTQINWSSPKPKYVFLLGDANYNYKVNNITSQKPIFPENFVPSYGFPVGDGWYVCFDSLSITPSIGIGRLPVRSDEDVLQYLEKHRKYVNAPYDDWNKRYILFTGGDPSKGQSSLDDLKNTNDRIANELIKPSPIGGQVEHFNKTIIPPTNFGPISSEYYNNAISKGGIIISYLGHSGTQTWDNSIGETSQLNNSVNRSPLISDFGCSTGKFAEPDINCFAELFVREKNSQAIGYVGNSALGFTSIASTLPYLFYGMILKDGITEIGEAHRLTKIKLQNMYGSGLVNLIAIQTNTLFCDPIIKLPIPPKPNLIIRNSWPKVKDIILTNKMDSLTVEIPYANYGRVISDTVEIQVYDYADGALLSSNNLVRRIPLIYDTLYLHVPIKERSGIRQLKITLDPKNLIDEITKSDNSTTYQYVVMNSLLQPLNTNYSNYGSKPDSITILNPVIMEGLINGLNFEFDRDNLFNNPQQVPSKYGNVFSRLLQIPTMSGQTNVSWRVKLSGGNIDPIGPFQYFNSVKGRSWIQEDSLTFSSVKLVNCEYSFGGLRLLPNKVHLKVISGGFNDGNFAVVEKNGINVLPNTFGYMYYVAVFDSVTLELKRIANFKTWGSQSERDSLSNYLKNIKSSEIIAVTTSDEPSNGRDTFKDYIKQLGSVYIDSLVNRCSWAMIGYKGAKSGSVPEGFRRSYEGRVIIDTNYQVPSFTGTIQTANIGPAYKWKTLYLGADRPANSIITIHIFGVNKTGVIDTLLKNVAFSDSLDLSIIDALKYRNIRLQANLVPGSQNESPIFKSWSVDYDYLPELALNYQSVYLLKDSVQQGIDLPFEIGVVNPGPSPAGNFNILIETIDQNNNRKPFRTLNVSGLKPDEWYNTSISLPTQALVGKCQIIVTVDPENLVDEQYENNNSFVLPFYIQRDTTRPKMNVTFDGSAPVDGDYIRPTPEIQVRLYDSGPLPITTSNNFIIHLDDTLLTSSNMPSLKFEPGSGTEKARITFSPQLSDGEHIFTFNAKDATGNTVDTSDFIVHVRVENALKILDIYNYPNPFPESTTFAFNLTGSVSPDDFKIKIYTVAGRHIKEINIPPSQLRIGFNTIQWDGRDGDGDKLGNGVYFYKIIYSQGGKSESIIGKIAVLR